MGLQPMTTGPCRHSPFLSRKEHRFSCFPLISFCILALCKNRTFRFTPVICKDCTILSQEWHNHSCGLMVCFKAGDWTLCTILGYGLPERETCCMLLFVQLSHSYLLHRGKSATCYRYCQSLTYSILFPPFFHRRIFRLSWRFP